MISVVPRTAACCRNRLNVWIAKGSLCPKRSLVNKIHFQRAEQTNCRDAMTALRGSQLSRWESQVCQRLVNTRWRAKRVAIQRFGRLRWLLPRTVIPRRSVR
jgi:hypothetical protein